MPYLNNQTHPIHLALLLLFSGTRERYFVHGGKRNGISVIATKNECMVSPIGIFLCSWLAQPNDVQFACTYRRNLDPSDNDLLVLANNCLELDNLCVFGN